MRRQVLDALRLERLRVAAQRLQGGNSAQCEQRSQREHQRDPYADRQPHRDRPPVERDAHVDGEKVLDGEGEHELNRDAERGTNRRSHESHRGRLGHIDRQHLPARRAKAAQYRHGVDLARDECVHSARDADPTEQERDEADDAEEIRKLFDRPRDVHLPLHDGRHAHVLALELRPERNDPRRAVRGGRQLQEPFVRRTAAEAEQLRPRRVALRQEHARSHHERGVRLPGSPCS